MMPTTKAVISFATQHSILEYDKNFVRTDVDSQAPYMDWPMKLARKLVSGTLCGATGVRPVVHTA